MGTILSLTEIDELKHYCTPTVANAVELFGVRSPLEGYMTPEIKCVFPDLGVMVGYAATATFRARAKAESSRHFDLQAYYDHILAQPEPRVQVAQDLDAQPLGALFGEVNSSVHQALGCVGHVTNGGARDLDECHAIGFQLFTSCVQVSHAYVHYEEFGVAVKVGGVVVHPGDLIHADKHGVCLIPPEVAPRIIEACAAMEATERPLLDLARTPGVGPDELVAGRDAVVAELQELAARFRLAP